MRRRNVKNAHERLVKLSNEVILDPTIYKGKWYELFKNDNPIYLEIGMGKGDFIIENAKRYPNINFIGLEKYESVILQAAIKLNALPLPNLYLICFDASELSKIFERCEISKIYLNFSDPWPKARHEKRRLTSKSFLNIYKEISKSPLTIEFKTDNKELFEYSLVSFNNNLWKFDELTFDLHKKYPDVIMTEYEKKFHQLGHNIYFVRAVSGE